MYKPPTNRTFDNSYSHLPQYNAGGIGQAGVLGVGLIFLIAETLAILTVLSFRCDVNEQQSNPIEIASLALVSAIVTNGEMSGGGSYYMVGIGSPSRIIFVC